MVDPLRRLNTSIDAKKRGQGSSAWIEKSVGLMSLKILPNAALSEDGSMVEWKYPDDPGKLISLPDYYRLVSCVGCA